VNATGQVLESTQEKSKWNRIFRVDIVCGPDAAAVVEAQQTKHTQLAQPCLQMHRLSQTVNAKPQRTLQIEIG